MSSEAARLVERLTQNSSAVDSSIVSFAARSSENRTALVEAGAVDALAQALGKARGAAPEAPGGTTMQNVTQTLFWLSSDAATRGALASSPGLVQDLVAVGMRPGTSRTHLESVKNAAGVLASMAQVKELRQQLAQDGVIECLIAIARAPGVPQRALVEVTRGLVVMMPEPNLREDVAARGGADVFLDIAGRVGMSPVGLNCAVKSLHWLASDVGNRATLIAKGTVQVLARVARNTGAPAQSRTSCFGCLYILAQEEEGRRLIVEHGAVESAVSMIRDTGHPELGHQYAAHMLFWVASKLEHKARCHAAGCVATAVGLLNNKGATAIARKNAAGILNALASHAPARPVYRELEAVRLLLDFARSPGASVEGVHQACSCIGGLSPDPDMRKHIADDCDGIAALTAALRRGDVAADNVGNAAKGITHALFWLASDDTRRTRFRDAGTIGALADTGSRSGVDAATLKNVLGCFAFLVQTRALRADLDKLGLGVVIMAGLRHPNPNAELLKNTLSCLWHWANADHQAEAAELGAIEAAVGAHAQAVGTDLYSKVAAKNAAGFLNTMSCKPEMRSRIIDAGAVDLVLLEVLSRSAEDSVAVGRGHAIRALSRLATSDALRPRLIELGVVAPLMQLLKREHPSERKDVIHALWWLSKEPDTAMEMDRLGIVGTLLAMLPGLSSESHELRCDSIKAMAGTLREILRAATGSRDPEHRATQAMIDAGVIEAMAAACTDSTYATRQRCALCLMGVVETLPSAAVGRVRDAGGVPWLRLLARPGPGSTDALRTKVDRLLVEHFNVHDAATRGEDGELLPRGADGVVSHDDLLHASEKEASASSGAGGAPAASATAGTTASSGGGAAVASGGAGAGASDLPPSDAAAASGGGGGDSDSELPPAASEQPGMNEH